MQAICSDFNVFSRPTSPSLVRLQNRWSGSKSEWAGLSLVRVSGSGSGSGFGLVRVSGSESEWRAFPWFGFGIGNRRGRELDGLGGAPPRSGDGFVIERASSGRAKCRACSQAIAKGEERFGEALPNAYGEGESLFWFHLRCAACCRPESLLTALDQGQGPAAPAEAEELRALARGRRGAAAFEQNFAGGAGFVGSRALPVLSGIDRAGAWRLALQMFEEGRSIRSGRFTRAARYIISARSRRSNGSRCRAISWTRTSWPRSWRTCATARHGRSNPDWRRPQAWNRRSSRRERVHDGRERARHRLA